MTKPKIKDNSIHEEIAISNAYFITIRTSNSLPINVIQQLRNDYQYRISIIEKELPDSKEILIPLEKKKYFGKLDQQLNQRINNDDLLINEKTISIVSEVLHEKDGEFYNLQAFSILPNHFHLLIDIAVNETPKGISEILEILKKKMKFRMQTELSMGGLIWQKENYYHEISTEKEWMNVCSYILTDPVRADLTSSSENWNHSYLKP